MAETTNTPAATGTPSGAAPAANGNGAGNTTNAEPGSLEDLLLAELGGESGSEGKAGDGDTAKGKEKGKDGADESDESELKDGDDETPENGEGKEEEDGDGETDDDDDNGEGDDDGESGEGAETGGMPKGVRQELENANVGKGLLKRIDNAFKQNATHRARIGELETELADRGEPVVLAPTERHPLSDIRTAEELEDREKGAQWWLDWCEDNPEGGTVGKGESARELTAEQVKQQRKWANTVLREVPKRQAWIGERTKAEAVARQAFPEMFHKGSPEFNAAKALTEGTPELVNQPDYHIVIADMVRGLKARVLESQGYKIVIVPPDKKGGKKGEAAAPKGGDGKAPVSPQKPNRPAPRPATTPTPPPGRVSGSKPDVNAAAARAATTGDVSGLLDAELA